MKRMACLGICCLGLLSFNVLGQQTIQIIDSQTGKEENYAWVKLLKNGFSPINKPRGAWKANYLENLAEGAQLLVSDSLFVGVYTSQFLPVWHKIDVSSTDTLIMLLEQDKLLENEFYPKYAETAGFPYTNDFFPRIITSLDSLPKADKEMILAKVEEYVGEELFEKLRV